MAISARSEGSYNDVSGSTTLTITLPTHQTGDMLIVRAACKPYDASITIATAGWQPVGDAYANGTTANGNGVGSVNHRAFWKVATSASETNPEITFGASVSPGMGVAIVYQKGASEGWATPVGAGGGDDTARTSQTCTISSHISVTSGDMVDFWLAWCDNYAATSPSISQTGVTFDSVTEYPATALSTSTGFDGAMDGGYRLASSGTSSAAAVVTGTFGNSEQGGAWQTRLRVFPIQYKSIAGSITPTGTLKQKVKKGLSNGSTYDALGLSTSPVTWLRGDSSGDRLEDLTGNGWHATKDAGTATYGADGPTISGQNIGAVQSDGSLYYSLSGSLPNASVTNGASIAVWVLLPGDSSASGQLVSRTQTNESEQRLVHNSDGTSAYQAYQTDGNTPVATAGDATDLDGGSWHLLIGWWNPADQDCYIQVDNGTPSSDVGSTNIIADSTAPTGIFSSPFGSGTLRSGSRIARAGIWNRVLTTEERSSLYTGTGGGLAPTGTVANEKVTNTVAVDGAVTPTGAVAKDVAELDAGAVTPTGTLKHLVKRAWAGAVTPTGAVYRTAPIAVAGSVTPTGAVIRKALTLPAGTVTPTGTLAQAIHQLVAGSVTPTGTLSQAATQSIAGSITPTGTHVALGHQLLAGAVTPTGAVANQKVTNPTVGISGAVTPTGATTKSALQLVAGTIDPSGALLQKATQSVAGAVTPTGVLTQLPRRRWDGAITPAGVVALTVGIPLAGAITPTGTLVHTVHTVHVGAMAPTGTLTQAATQTLAGSITPTGVHLATAMQLLAGAITPAGAVANDVLTNTVAVDGAIAPSSTVARKPSTRPAGAITPVGSHLAAVAALLGGSAAPAGVLTKRVLVPLAGSIAPTGTVGRSASILPAGAIAPTGTVAMVADFVIVAAGGIAPSGALTVPFAFLPVPAARVRELGWGAASVVSIAWSYAEVRTAITWVPGADYFVALGTVLPTSGHLHLEPAILRAGLIVPQGTFHATQRLVSISGSITPTGEAIYASTGPDTQAVAGSITPTGAEMKLARARRSGSTAPSAALLRFAKRRWVGAIAPAGAVRRKATVHLAGAITPAGVHSYPAFTYQQAISGSVTPTSNTLIFGDATQVDIAQKQFSVEWRNRPGCQARCEYADNPSFSGSYLTILETDYLDFHSQQIGNGNPVGSPPLQPNTTYFVRQLLTASTGQTRTTAAQQYTTAIARVSLAGGIVPAGYHAGGGSGTIKYKTISGAITPTGATTTRRHPLVYGAGAAADSRNDYEVGKGANGAFAITFRASATGTVDSISWPLRTDPSNTAYSKGTGGSPAWSIYPAKADGRPNVAAGRIGSRSPALSGISPFEGGTVISRNVWVTDKPSLVAGQLYVAVLENLHADAANNYCALNRLFLWNSDIPPGHSTIFPFDFWHRAWRGNQNNPVTTSTVWTADTADIAGIDVKMTGAAGGGQAYDNTGLFLYGGGYTPTIIGGNNLVRDRIVVSGGDKTIQTLYVRVGRQSGTGSLTIALKNSGGTTLRSVVVPYTSVAYWNLPDPWTANGTWVGGSVTAQTLSNGQVYYLELSAPAGSQYSMTGILHTINNDTLGSGKAYADMDGYSSPAFRDGTMQVSTNGGGSWADAYAYTPIVMQSFMDLA